MALDFAMGIAPGNDNPTELYPNVAAVGAIYGDPTGNYTSFLARVDAAYPAEPYFLWNQPLSDNGWVSSNPNYGGSPSNNNGNSTSGSTGDGNGSIKVVASTISLATLSMLAAWLLD